MGGGSPARRLALASFVATTRRRDSGHLRSRPAVLTELAGQQLLSDPALNAGTAFSDDQRDAFHLHWLLPPVVETLAQQCARCEKAYRSKTDDLERHLYLRALQDNNATLFYALL